MFVEVAELRGGRPPLFERGNACRWSVARVLAVYVLPLDEAVIAAQVPGSRSCG
jgi:hypothetical protein